MRPLVSINVPTYNSERTLDECLRSVKNQTYKNIEIIVVDGYSSDRTLEIARKYGASIYFSKMLSEAREVAVEKSFGKYVLLLDSDQILEPHAIEKCVNKCEKDGWNAITLFERSLIRRHTFVERVVAYDKWLFHSLRDDHAIYGAAIPRFFKTEVLKKLNWPKDLVTFDHNFLYYEAAKEGAKVCFLDVYIYHHEPSSWTEVVRKFYRYGRHYIPALRKNRELVMWHSMPRRTYFSKRALTKPSLFVGLFLLYFVKGFAALMGALVYCLERK